MKKAGELIAVCFIALMVLSTFASAQAQAESYSGFARFGDNIKLFFARGDDKVKLALEIRDKEVASAIENAQAGDTENAVKNLESASDKLEIVQQSASANISEEVKLSVEEIERRIAESENLTPEFKDYLENHLTEEEKTRLSAEMSEKLYDYCSSLAGQDYEIMLKDEKCNPENAPAWLKKDIEKKSKEAQQQAAEEMIKQLTTCISDPRECDCSKIPVVSEQSKCEKSKALAIRCEFQDDRSACDQLDEMKPEIPSNMPAFLKPIFEKTMQEAIGKKEKEMFNKLAPKECIEAGATTREECEKIMMEKFAPQECIEAGATTKEACEQIMFAKYGPPPTECMNNGEFIGEDECEQKMVESGRIPQECVEGGKFIGKEECEQKMISSGRIPEECIKDGKPIPEQECLEKMLPPPCKEAGAYTREACEEIMMNYQGPPMECLDEQGGFIGEEECSRIMQEIGTQQPKQAERGAKKGSSKQQKIPQECVGLTFDECENLIMERYIPKECQDANVLTPEQCEKIMLPPECQDAGALSREDCEAVMIKKKMPKECQDADALTPDKCAKLMSSNIEFSEESELDFLNKRGIRFSEVPEACKRGSDFVRGMECDKALADMGIMLPAPQDISNIPKECIKDGQPVSPEECREILKDRIVNENIPEQCRQENALSPEECGRVMEKNRQEQGIGINMPPECLGKSPDECRTIMEERGIRMERIEPGERTDRAGRIEQIGRECGGNEDCINERRGRMAEENRENRAGREREGMSHECASAGISDSDSCEIFMSRINEERIKNGDRMIVDGEGNQQFITNEQINSIAEDAERRAEQLQPDLAEAQEIGQEIQDINDEIQQIDERQEQFASESSQSGQPSQAQGQEGSSSGSGSSASFSSEPSSSSSGGGEGSSSPAPEAAPAPSPAPESAPVTGGAITESSGSSKTIIQRFFDFFFRR